MIKEDNAKVLKELLIAVENLNDFMLKQSKLNKTVVSLIEAISKTGRSLHNKTK